MVEHSLKLLASEEKATSTILSKGILSSSILSTGTLSSNALPSSTLARAASRATRTHLWLDRARKSGVLHKRQDPAAGGALEAGRKTTCCSCAPHYPASRAARAHTVKAAAPFMQSRF